MTKAIASLLLGLLSFFRPSDAQADTAVSAQDRWVVYERTAPDGKPLVVSARTGNAHVEALLLNGRATVVTCRTDPANVNDRGMPRGTERFYPVEDNLDIDPILVSAGAIHVASVTGQGQRRIYILHRDPIDLSRLLQTDPIDGFSCDTSEVGDREALLQLVTPSLIETQLSGDEEVVSQLQGKGDDGRTPRKTDFWFYGERAALERLSDTLKAHDFSIDHWLSDPTGVVLSRNMPAHLAVFQELTPVIVHAAEKSQVVYDGWETIVISQSLTPTERNKPSDTTP